MKQFSSKNAKIIQLIGILGLIILPLALHGNRYMPSVLNDEIGYLANAAYFGGSNWSGILSGIPYYSYGYSLIISPLYAFLSDGQLIYVILLLLNGVFGAVNFVLSCKIAKALYPDEKEVFLVVACFVSGFSGSAIIFSQFAWAESLLFMWMTAIVWIIVCILKKPTYLRCTILAIFTLYIYMIHQRTVAVVIAVSILMIVLTFNKKINWKHLLIYSLVLLVCLTIHVYFKENLRGAIWSQVSTSSANDYSGQFSKIKYILSVNGIKDFILSVFGKIYALVISYGLFPAIAVCYLYQRLRYIVVNKKKDICDADIILAFLCIASLLSVGVASVFFITPERPDQIVYTRYSDYIFSVMPMICLMIMRKEKIIKSNWSKKIILSTGILACLVLLQAKMIDETKFISIQSPVLSLFSGEMTSIGVVSIFLSVIFVGLYSFYCRKKVFQVVSLILIGVVSFYTGVTVIDNFRQTNVVTEQMENDLEDFSEKLKRINFSDQNVYLLRKDGDSFMAYYYGGILQAQNPELQFVYRDTLNEINDAYVITWNKGEIGKIEGQERLYWNQYLTLYEYKSNKKLNA